MKGAVWSFNARVSRVDGISTSTYCVVVLVGGCDVAASASYDYPMTCNSKCDNISRPVRYIIEREFFPR